MVMVQHALLVGLFCLCALSSMHLHFADDFPWIDLGQRPQRVPVLVFYSIFLFPVGCRSDTTFHGQYTVQLAPADKTYRLWR